MSLTISSRPVCGFWRYCCNWRGCRQDQRKAMLRQTERESVNDVTDLRTTHRAVCHMDCPTSDNVIALTADATMIWLTAARWHLCWIIAAHATVIVKVVTTDLQIWRTTIIFVTSCHLCLLFIPHRDCIYMIIKEVTKGNTFVLSWWFISPFQTSRWKWTDFLSLVNFKLFSEPKVAAWRFEDSREALYWSEHLKMRCT
jgi:hypothetical protein